jgi:hypothetical protein
MFVTLVGSFDGTPAGDCWVGIAKAVCGGVVGVHDGGRMCVWVGGGGSWRRLFFLFKSKT